MTEQQIIEDLTRRLEKETILRQHAERECERLRTRIDILKAGIQPRQQFNLYATSETPIYDQLKVIFEAEEALNR